MTISPLYFLGSSDDFEASKIILVGIPFDQAGSFQSGCRFAPDMIRMFSDAIETFSPYQKKDLISVNFYDAGNILINSYVEEQFILDAADDLFEILDNKKKLLCIGGDHLISFACINALSKINKDFKIIHFDAHLDLRENYANKKLSHATVMRRCGEIIGFENIVHIGTRSIDNSEYNFIGQQDQQAFMFDDDLSEIKEYVKNLTENNKYYITLDLDFFDPSIMKAVTNPEPNGFSIKNFLDILNVMNKDNFLSGDVNELSPFLDTSFNSTIFSALIIREILLRFSDG